MGLNSTSTSWGFGQLGSGFLATNSDITAPAGKVIVSITILVGATFDSMVADTTNAADLAFIGTATQTAQNGAGSETFAATSYPAGITLYGRWSTVGITAGDIVVYYGY